MIIIAYASLLPSMVLAWIACCPELLADATGRLL